MAFPLLGDDATHAVKPTPIPDPYWVAFSTSAAKLIDLPLGSNDLPKDSAWLDLLAGNTLVTDAHSFPNPIATVYSGHQFGVWAGQLGDGRAILLGEISGQELQLKGAGKTRYSRMGDGRAVLRSSIREFLCSEAMHALGIPTSRALAVVGSDLPVRRETMETAAVCARLAPSFIRIGHFEHYASNNNIVRLQELADELIKGHYQNASDHKNPYLELFRQICVRNAKLVAQWQAVGFCHGVLNSDNISVLGLTIDYGPFGFLDQFQIDFICNHSDQAGRYAYHRQPQIMHWNMACLASAFIPLLALEHSEDEAQTLLGEALSEFAVIYGQTWQALFREKLGLLTTQEGDTDLIERLLQAMHDSKVDFTNLFRGLSSVSVRNTTQDVILRDHFIDRQAIDQWFSDYIARLNAESSDDTERKKRMDSVNPKYILRNYLAQKAIDKAQAKDFSEIASLLKVLENPFAEQDQYAAYALPPSPDWQSVEISCSS
ncbi:YdiU family protein [Polynucleobacter sp. MWH-Creno-3A4]|uniref:protein adenylyltransferase SelO n=1 Tax=Polynucleobacter sp. MWH-Creno-3A4 TaxID=1855886 RepID=UPI001C0D7825|nr:YdiU family protein [Polynucleobacter sp. MWH-Creno-3A4]MBU3606719.1 YdiU family protein [Polynucleobacter sp. MWH-Creno-3A4]